MSKPMQETNEKGQNYADNSISMQIEAIIEDSHRPVQATKRIMELLESEMTGVSGLEGRFCDWNSPKGWAVTTTPREVENWVVNKLKGNNEHIK